MKDTKNPSRRQFLKTGVAMAVGGAAGLGGVMESKAASKPNSDNALFRPGRPNILLMMVDEMRYPPVYEAEGAKLFRQRYLRTQNALRANGVEFHRHYAASTACAPSRSSIFTGHYPSLHGVTQTTGAAKEANDPDVFWLDPNGVPTMGDYFRAGGYRTFYKGKWHVSNADLQIPGTHDQIVSYDDQGNRDPEAEQLYLEADRLQGYGFEGWIGPEPHGSAPLNTGSSPAGKRGRDEGFAQQVVELIGQLDDDPNDDPWLMVASFVNPHDIALWGFVANNLPLFDFNVEDAVPGFTDLFDPLQFARTLTDDLSTKPSCQESYQTSYHEWMQGVPPHDYFRYYYQLHKNVDEDLFTVYQALSQSKFFENTIVVFTSDHGDLLGSHRYMHQKWYQTYDEALRVPLIISNHPRAAQPASVQTVTSHVDLLPTLLGLAGLDPLDLHSAVAEGHSDPLPLVGRDLSRLVVESDPRPLRDPIYFMTDDDPSRGLNQENFYGVGYDSVIQPNSIESVIVEIRGEVWKYSRYFDNVQFWSDPEPLLGPTKDVVLTVDDTPLDVPGVHPVPAEKRVKLTPENEEFEMYNVTRDPMELDNLYGSPLHARTQDYLASLLDRQRARKRLYPVSGEVPGQP